MAIEAQARITLRGGPEALRALQGVTRGTAAATAETKKAAQETERWQRLAIRSHQQRIKEQDALSKSAAKSAQQQAKSAQQVAAAKEKAAQDAMKSAQREAKAIEAIQQRQAERWQRMAQQSAAVRSREEAKVTESARREAAKQIDIAKKTAAAEVDAARKRNRDIGGLIGVGTGAVLAGGIHAVNTAKRASGSKSAQERLQAANGFRERLVRVTNDAGMTSEQRESVQGQVLGASKSTGMDIGELAGVLETGQGQFNNLQYFSDQLESIGRIAKAGGVDARELATAIGFANQAFELTGQAAEDSGYIMKGAANMGAIELSDLSSSFAPLAGTYAETTKHKGAKGYREFLGMAEAMGTSGFTGERAATRVQGVIAAVSGVDVQKDLETKAGIKRSSWVGKDGSLDLPSLIRQLSNSKKFENASVRQDIFKDIRGQQGIEALVSANHRVRQGVKGAVDIDTFMGLTAEGGRASVDAGMTAMQGEGFFKAQQEAANMQADTVTHMGELNGQVGLLTSAANKLELAFGSLSFWAGSIAAAGVTGVAGSVLKGMVLGKGGAAAAEVAGGAAKSGWLASAAAGGMGLLKAGATGAIGLAGGGVAGAVGAGLAVGGSVGLAANYGTGMIRDDGKSISDLVVDAIFERAQKQQLSAGGTRNADGTLIAALKDQTAKLASIDAGLRATNAKPAPGGAREPR